MVSPPGHRLMRVASWIQVKHLHFKFIAVIGDVNAVAKDGGGELTAGIGVVEDVAPVMDEPELFDGGMRGNVFAYRLDAMVASFHEHEVTWFDKPIFQLTDVPDIA